MPARTRHLVRGLALVALIVGVGFLVAVLVWSDRPHVRYASAPCLYEKTFAQGGQVDVAIVGTSRAKMGISPETMSATLPGDPTVVNLARAWKGTDFMLQQLRDIDAERGIIEAIVVEYSREGTVFATTRRYYDQHPEHAALMPISRLVDDLRLKPREPFYLRLRDLLHFGQQRLEFALDRLIQGTAACNLVLAADERPVVGSTGCTGIDRSLNQGALDSWAERVLPSSGLWEDRESITPAWNHINNDTQRETIRRMVAFADERGIPIFFVWFPRYLDPPVDDGFAELFEEEFSAPLLIPPPAVLAALNDGGYSDPNHLHEPGREIYTAWLAQQIGGQSGP
jgi:hypothetical protein